MRRCLKTPSVDDKMEACSKLPVGDSRTQCWANLDKYLMEQVVPWVPYRTPNFVVITSTRVAHLTYDDSAGWIAFDQVSLVNGGK